MNPTEAISTQQTQGKKKKLKRNSNNFIVIFIYVGNTPIKKKIKYSQSKKKKLSYSINNLTL